MNVTEKILARASGRARVAPGDLVTVEVATAVMHDLMFTKRLWREPLKLRDPERIVIIFDHIVPSNSVEIAEVRTINPSTMSSASNFPTLKSSPRIFTIARLTQPRMMQLMGMPR